MQREFGVQPFIRISDCYAVRFFLREVGRLKEPDVEQSVDAHQLILGDPAEIYRFKLYLQTNFVSQVDLLSL